MTYYVNIFSDVKNVNGTRYSKDVASVNTDDHSINNSFVDSFPFDNKASADKFADDINSKDYV